MPHASRGMPVFEHGYARKTAYPLIFKGRKSGQKECPPIGYELILLYFNSLCTPRQ